MTKRDEIVLRIVTDAKCRHSRVGPSAGSVAVIPDNHVVVVVSNAPFWGDVGERREDGRRTRVSGSAVRLDIGLEQIQH